MKRRVRLREGKRKREGESRKRERMNESRQNVLATGFFSFLLFSFFSRRNKTKKCVCVNEA